MDPRIRKYVKTGATLVDAVATSVTLDKRQAEFVRRNNLNLSAMVRDFLDQLIDQTEGEANGSQQDQE
jgi:hypothetical protein